MQETYEDGLMDINQTEDTPIYHDIRHGTAHTLYRVYIEVTLKPLSFCTFFSQK